MSEIAPDTFDALMAELYNVPLDQHERHRSDYVYRGLDVASWGLQTSLQRLGNHYADVETPLMRNFIKYSIDRDLASETFLYKLAFAQHHGLPTRVLDWSTAPKVALHFAVGDENHFDKDGVIWAVNVVAIRNLLPKELDDILRLHRAVLFSVDMFDNSMTLELFTDAHRSDSFVLFFEPPSLDHRIVNQAAILSIMPIATLDHREFFENHPAIFRRIIVRKELKWQIRDKLDQDQINERMLFPGEDGTARWLKRYYGPGPRKPAKAATAPPAFTGPMTGTGS